jgi:Cu-Zn family superoxide dismutase
MRHSTIPLLIASSVALAACGQREQHADRAAGGQPNVADTAKPGSAAVKASAFMHSSAGRSLGALKLTDVPGGIRVEGKLTGLPPGEHAIHLHTTGQCDGPKFESAGGHWNPSNKQHGTKSPEGPHQGDLPNITVARDSSVTIDATTPGGSLAGQDGLLDNDAGAVVVHAKADDYQSQPAGNAGDRIACGVVQLASD